MKLRSYRRIVVGLALMLASSMPASLLSQGAAVITTSGNGEQSVAPDRATATFGIDVLGETANEASERSAERLEQFTAALVALGLARESIPTTSFTVVPNYNFTSEGREQDGYRGSLRLPVRVNDLTRLGAVIGAALGAGANSLLGVRFESSQEERIRALALRAAVANARSDAEALAEAAGGRLGDLLELTTENLQRPRMMALEQVQARGVGPDLTPQEIVVRVRVIGRWRMQDEH